MHVTTPNPGTLASSPQTTLTYYNSNLQATNVVQPDNTSVSSAFYLTGELAAQSGSRNYPVGYSYDYAGRMQTMTNWSGFPGTGARVTIWNYDPYRGWLSGKSYDNGQSAGPTYSYTAAGRLGSRAWARGTNTVYSYSGAGDLFSINYSDGSPGVTNTYDRRGRQTSVTQNGIVASLSYDDANDLLGESYSGGLLSGLAGTNTYDGYLRRATLVVKNSGTAILQHAFGYDGASRLQTVTDNSGSPAYSATNSYLANSPLVSQILFKQSTTTRMTTTKQYDYLNRLLSVASTPSAANFSYSYNNANQRIRSTLSDGSYWLYTYDSLGQVNAGNKYWADGTPVAGQQFDYAFDTIGNRTQTKAGGDQNGAGLRTASYSANNLNQYTSRDVPGAVDVMGIALGTNTVTVNSLATYRKGEYFRKELAVDNSASPVWESVSVSAAGESTVSGGVFVPRTRENFTYDADGNLTNDGCWAYTWDAENRLVRLAANTGAGPQNSIKFEYDWRGRRIHKQVWGNTGWSGTPTNDLKFVYDGWNLLDELNATNNAVIRSFMWGSDLSGRMQGAGGVGGLLKVTYNGAQTTNCFVAYDGNGNVAALVDAASTNILAQYTYGPFGEVIRATGPMAKANPFRFSTKYQDDETDLLYYGYRYMKDGRWLNRDPLGDEAFLVMASTDKPPQEQQLLRSLSLHPSYPFTRNNAINYIDPNGQLVVAVVVGGAAIVTLAIMLPDWDARSLTQAEAQQVQTLLLALKGCARNKGENEIIAKLEAMTVAGAFKKPRDNDDSAETRNGRFFGYGNRTLLPSKFLSEEDWLKFNILLHESYHAATEDWTEDHSYTYANEKLEKVRCCLETKGYKFPKGPLQ